MSDNLNKKQVDQEVDRGLQKKTKPNTRNKAGSTSVPTNSGKEKGDLDQARTLQTLNSANSNETTQTSSVIASQLNSSELLLPSSTIVAQSTLNDSVQPTLAETIVTPPIEPTRGDRWSEQFFTTLQSVFIPLQQQLQSLLDNNREVATSRTSSVNENNSVFNSKECIIIEDDDGESALPAARQRVISSNNERRNTSSGTLPINTASRIEPLRSRIPIPDPGSARTSEEEPNRGDTNRRVVAPRSGVNIENTRERIRLEAPTANYRMTGQLPSNNPSDRNYTSERSSPRGSRTSKSHSVIVESSNNDRTFNESRDSSFNNLHNRAHRNNATQNRNVYVDINHASTRNREYGYEPLNNYSRNRTTRGPSVATGANEVPCSNVHHQNASSRNQNASSRNQNASSRNQPLSGNFHQNRFRRNISPRTHQQPSFSTSSSTQHHFYNHQRTAMPSSQTSSDRHANIGRTNNFRSENTSYHQEERFHFDRRNHSRPPHEPNSNNVSSPPSNSNTAPSFAPAGASRHGSDIFDMLDSSTAFAYPSEDTDFDHFGYTLHDLWNIDAKTIRFMRQEMESYNMNSEKIYLRDYMAWFSFNVARLKTKSLYEATFALTYFTGPEYTQPVLNRYGPPIVRFNLQELATEFGREVYVQQAKNPAEVARRLEIGRDNITTRQGLLQRVVDLTFCRAKQKYVVDFCYDLMAAIAYHAENKEQQAFFVQQVHRQYPQIKLISDIMNGRKSVSHTEYKVELLKNADVPRTSRDCRRFAGWLVLTALDDNYSFRGKFEDRRNFKMPAEGNFNKRPVRYVVAEEVKEMPIHELTNGKEEDSMANVMIIKAKEGMTRKVVASSNAKRSISTCPPTATASVNATTNKASGKRKLPNPTSPPKGKRFCSQHGDGNHEDDNCWSLHPELMDRKCRKHPKDDHTIKQCLEKRRALNKQSNLSEKEEIAVYQLEYESEADSPVELAIEVKRRNVHRILSSLHRENYIFSYQSLLNYRTTVQNTKNEVKSLHILESEVEEFDDDVEMCEVSEIKDDSNKIFENHDSNKESNFVRIYLPFVKPINNPNRCSQTHIQLGISDVSHIVLCDTGASLTIISEMVLNKLTSKKIAELQHPLVLTPFNSNESTSITKSRNTFVNQIALLPVRILNYLVEFPFYIFPGLLSSTLIGIDFLECCRSIINIPQRRVEFEVPKDADEEHVNNFLKEQVTQMMLSRKESYFQRDINNINFVQHCKRSNRVVIGVASESTELLPNEWNTLIVQPEKGVLQWGIYYQISVLDETQGFSSFEPLNDHFITNSSTPTDLIFIDVRVSHYRQIEEGEKVLSFTPLKQQKVSQCIMMNEEDETFLGKVDFQPIQLFDELPLPHQQLQLSVTEYSNHEKDAIKTEIDHYVTKEENDRFVSPHPGLKIHAGDEFMSNEQLALMAKTLSLVTSKVWHNSQSKEKFPGIPEEDVAVRIPLKNEAPIQHKVRRLNDKLHQRCREQLQKEMDLGLIEDSNSEFAFPILCVEKKNGKLRVCGDYRTLNEVAVVNRYPLPLIEHLTASLRGAKFISLFDLSSGFQQLYVYAPHRGRLAIITPFGLYQPIRMPYGYLNGPPIFQKEYDRTLGSMVQWGRAYVDDLPVHDSTTQRSHDMKVATVLHNIARRGMVVNQEKTTLLRTSLPYLGIMISGEGVKAIQKLNTFELLLAKKHRNLLSLQQTVGALNWFRKFIPNYSQLVSPIYAALKSIGLYDLDQGNDLLDQICRPVITKVKTHLDEQMLLCHPDYEAEKHIYLYIGEIAFACSLWQVTNDKKKKEFVEYWSKRWPNDVTKYSEDEKYALATREVIKHFAALLQIAIRTFIYTGSQSFTQIVNHPEFRSPKAAHYLVITHAYLLTFQTKPQEEFSMLNEQPHDQELSQKITTLSVAPLARFFRITASEVAKIPIVRTDGSFRKSVVQGGMGAIGVYWGPNSHLNVSRWAVHPPFTNQRAELEAILCALEQAHKQQLPRLIVYSDSTYALGLFNSLSNRNLRCSQNSCSKLLQKRNAGLPPMNQDLLEKASQFLQNLKVYFQHIKRDFNLIADRLSKQPFQLLFSERQLEKKNKKSLPAKQNPLTAPTHPDAFSSATESQPDPLAAEVSAMIVDNRILKEEILGNLEVECFQQNFQHQINYVFQVHCNHSSSQQMEETEIRCIKDLDDTPEVFIDDVDTDDEVDHPDTNKKERQTLASPPAIPPTSSTPNYNQQFLVTILKVMSKHQFLDEDISSLIRSLEKKDPTLATSEVAYLYNEAFIVPSSSILWVRMKGIDRILVPKSLRVELISLHHCSSYYANHGGLNATLHHLLRLFTWRTIKEDVAEFCRNCLVCLATKPLNTKSPGLLTPAPLAIRPLQQLSVDCLTNLPITIGTRFQHVLVAIDSFTRFLFAIPLQKLTASLVARALTSIFVLFGAPRTLLTDKGGEFRNDLINELARNWGIRHVFTATKNPQANGQAEVSVRLVTQGLLTRLTALQYLPKTPQLSEIKLSNSGKSCALHHKWDAILPAFVYSHNTTYSDRLGCSPYELMFGRSPPVAHDLRIEEAQLLHGNKSSFHACLQQSLQTLHETAQRRQERFRSYSQRHYDKFRSALKVEVGDWVFVSPPHDTLTRKLSPAREGPYKVLAVYRQRGTREPTAVKVELRRDEDIQESRVYPRYRIRVIRGFNPPLNWENLKQEADETIQFHKDWECFSPKSIDDSNIVCQLMAFRL